MTASKMCLLLAVFALSMSTLCAVDAQACTSCGTPAVSFYQPATYTASYQPTTFAAVSQPVAYQSFYPTYANTGWYPGYWMDRWSARAAARQTVYTTAYQPTYTVGYATTSFAPSYSYASSGCSTCTASYAPCSSCSSTQQVTMMPVSTGCGCEPCGSACGCTSTVGCSSCGSSGVSQASYIESSVQPASGCSSCGQSTTTGSTTFVPQPIQGAPQGSQQQLEPTPAPSIPSNQPVAPDRTNVNKPADTSVVQPPPAAASSPATTTPPAATTPPAETSTPTTPPGSTPEGTGGATEQNNSTFVAPPLLLFNPQDKTAQTPSRVAAPVTVAIYERPLASSPAATKVSSKAVSRQQAQQDAVGWTSVSH